MKLFDDLKVQLKAYFNLKPYLEDEAQAKQAIIEGVTFRGPTIIILILAIIVACLGLSTNNAVVIIGAMLISPLMGPIIGIGLGVGTYDFALIKRSARNLAAATIFSIIASAIFFLISPVSEGRSELLARTSPTIYDVLIGFFGGAAGIVAMACKQKGNVIPGVAIATALMPPLCTVGYGLATLQVSYMTGALYLFIINSIFIALSSLIGVKLFKFHEVNFVNPQRRLKIKRVVTTIVIATILPSIYLTVLMLRESFFVRDADTFIQEEFNLPNTQVFCKDAYIKDWKKHIDVTLIGAYVNTDSLKLALTSKMDKERMLRGADLEIKQGFSTTSHSVSAPQSMSDVFSGVVVQLERQRATIDSLNSIINNRNKFDSVSYWISPELKVLYPNITYIALNRSLICNTETRKVDTINVALIEHDKPLNDLPTIQRYIETRTGLPNIRIIQTNFELQSQAKPKE